MENEKTPLSVAFSTQKGGVGTTTFTVLAASYLYYLCLLYTSSPCARRDLVSASRSEPNWAKPCSSRYWE